MHVCVCPSVMALIGKAQKQLHVGIGIRRYSEVGEFGPVYNPGIASRILV